MNSTNRQVIQGNLTSDEGSGVNRVARRFHPGAAAPNDPDSPGVTRIIFRKPVVFASRGTNPDSSL